MFLIFLEFCRLFTVSTILVVIVTNIKRIITRILPASNITSGLHVSSVSPDSVRTFLLQEDVQVEATRAPAYLQETRRPAPTLEDTSTCVGEHAEPCSSV